VILFVVFLVGGAVTADEMSCTVKFCLGHLKNVVKSR